MNYSNAMLRDVYRYHLCTWFILPFCRVTMASFGGYTNFINSFVSNSGTEMYVKIFQMNMCEPTAFECIHYQGTSGNNIIGYRIPKKWWPEVQKYKDGMYSQFSTKAKDFLKANSGLNYMNEEANNKFMSDVRLLALDRDEVLRQKLIEELQIVLTPDQELLQAPGKESFMTI